MIKYHVFQAKEKNTKRIYDEKSHKIRNEFARDRDRILYSKAFRRLSGKTQVFIAGSDDHIRTRLTHTLEVSQIANTISTSLGLDTLLTEAIAIGHDIGHTPFGHVGERTLNYIMNGCNPIKDFNRNMTQDQKGFKHNWQSVRVVTELEETSRQYPGLNLTDYTLWGILHHSKIYYKPCDKKTKTDSNVCNLRHEKENCINYQDSCFSVDFYKKYEGNYNENSWTLEGLVVALADEIAQRHHDVEDGIEENIIDVKELMLIFKETFRLFLDEDDKRLIKYIGNEKSKIYYLPAISKLIVNFLTSRLIKDTMNTLNDLMDKYKINNSTDFYKQKQNIKNDNILENIVNYSIKFQAKEKTFQEYLRSRILNSFKAQSMDGKSNYVIKQLFKAYLTNPQQLPDKTIVSFYENRIPDEVMQIDEKKCSLAELTGKLRDRLEKDYYTDITNQYKGDLLRTICDYIGGMTDNYALKQYSILYGTKKVGE